MSHAARPSRLALLALALAAALSLALAAGAASAPAKRVVALEWDALEGLVALGVTPVGAADPDEYARWVGVPIPGGIEDVGTRQQPSIVRIAALRPDLVVAPRFRNLKGLDTLERYADTLVLDAYPRGGGDAQYKAMIGNFRATARAVGRRARGEAVLRELDATYAQLRRRLRRAGRAGARVALATPGGTFSAPQARVMTSNSLAAGVLRRLGLKNGWTGADQSYGYATVGVEALAALRRSWLAFVYPPRYRSLVSRFTSLELWTRSELARKGRVRHLKGDTWMYGGPRSARLLAQRVVAALTRR